MSYTVLARRYRSASFDEIVGQNAIAQTLKNAIDVDRTAHAYLFTGTRGVGKTSMARIFARELNLSDDLREKEHIGEAILQGTDLDVIEIDGASNRGVQEARDLIASAGLAPARCKYRIYIIDEVHMLTTPAFNALLKTMEEPPSHVKFILCTTEPHKVPATIQSRCQLFNFRSIPTKSIASHLETILKKEGVSADPQVTLEIARLGNGSMRDALSILDRLLSHGTQTITKEEMQTILGLPQEHIVDKLCQAISDSSLKDSFEATHDLICSGISLDRALDVIAAQLRNAMIFRACGDDTDILELSEESINRSRNLSNTFDEASLTHMIALCDASSRQVRRGGTGRSLFDATIARLCMTSQLLTATKVVSNKTKKKMNAPPSAHNVKQQENTPTHDEPKHSQELTWDLIQQKIANTAGIKSIATHLCFHSLDGNRLTLKIKDSGREATQYILSMRESVELALSQLADKKMNVKIISEVQNSHATVDKASMDEIGGNDLVKTARGLFEGTIVRVTDLRGEG